MLDRTKSALALGIAVAVDAVGSLNLALSRSISCSITIDPPYHPGTKPGSAVTGRRELNRRLPAPI
jgi:hypothetical protein